MSPAFAHPTTTSSSSSYSESLANHAAFASELADVARTVILPYWRKKNLQVDMKIEPDRAMPTSPVTIADRAAEEKMRYLIQSKYPSHGVYGEEFGPTQTDAEWVWVLDPIDGTKSFITGKPLFGTLIACLHNGVPVIGVIDHCALNERWCGIAGQPTTLNGEPIQSSTHKTKLSESILYATTPDMFADGIEKDSFSRLQQHVKTTLYGADCYAYGLVASGFGTDLVVEADLGLYDYCALVPVVEGAGGVMTDWNGEKLSLQQCEASQGRVVAACSEAIHREALGILQNCAAVTEKGNNKSNDGNNDSSGIAKVPNNESLLQSKEVLLSTTLLLGIAIGMTISRAVGK